MADGSSDTEKAPDGARVTLRSVVVGAASVLRFLTGDRVGLTVLAWFILAYLARPMAMEAHAGVGGATGAWLRGAMDAMSLARLAGMLQWASLATMMLVIALVHTRLAARISWLATYGGRLTLGMIYTAALGFGYLVFVWTPTTTASLMLHDTFIFFDAIYRIEHGQTPSTDFPTALGAVSLYLPALGAWLAGGFAGSIELASALVSLLLCAACALAGARRHSSFVTAALIGAIFLIVVPCMLEGYPAPASVTTEGDEPMLITGEFAQAMFYNRWGWGALIAMFAFLTPRKHGEPAPLSEIVALGLIVAFLFHLKFSYFAVAGAAAVLYAAFGAKPWRTLAIGGGVAVGGILAVGLAIGNLISYVRDVLEVASISGGRAIGLASLIKNNLAIVLAATGPLVLLALLGRAKSQDAWVAALMICGSLFIINQNAQVRGLPTLLALAAYGVWRASEGDNRAVKVSAMISFCVLALTGVMERGNGLMDQTVISRQEEAREPASWTAILALNGVRAQERENMLARFEESDGEDSLQAAFRRMAFFGRRQFLRSGEYLMTMEAAIADLKPVMQPGDSVVVMDFSSPLAFLMGARPADGYWITFDNGRTISEDRHPDPAVLFADADHVMAPKLYVEPNTGLLLKALYSDWLAAHYQTTAETRYWVRYSRRKPAQ